MTTYYVRRGAIGEESSVRMSTPSRLDALRNAADGAIVNPNFIYTVYEGSEKGHKIAEFKVEE